MHSLQGELAFLRPFDLLAHCSVKMCLEDMQRPIYLGLTRECESKYFFIPGDNCELRYTHQEIGEGFTKVDSDAFTNGLSETIQMPERKLVCNKNLPIHYELLFFRRWHPLYATDIVAKLTAANVIDVMHAAEVLRQSDKEGCPNPQIIVGSCVKLREIYENPNHKIDYTRLEEMV